MKIVSKTSYYMLIEIEMLFLTNVKIFLKYSTVSLLCSPVLVVLSLVQNKF